MKITTTKEWFRSRSHLEEGQSIEVRPAKETPSSGSERRLVRDLIDVGTGKIPHIFMGQCPDSVDGHDQRDKSCRACRVLIRAKSNIANTESIHPESKP